jgi:hypothetical protein
MGLHAYTNLRINFKSNLKKKANEDNGLHAILQLQICKHLQHAFQLQSLEYEFAFKLVL